MPYAWADPEVYLIHRGVRVFRTYRHDNLNEPATNWFTLHFEYTHDSDELQFDVRDLERELQQRGLMPDELVVGEYNGQVTDDDNEFQVFIRLALDNGLIELPEGVEFDTDQGDGQPFLDLYLKDGETCPFCGRKEEIEGGHVETGRAQAIQHKMGCAACEAEWMDYYRLESVARVN